MKNVKEYFENRRIHRDYENENLEPMVRIIRAKATAEELEALQRNREAAILNKPLYELKAIKERFNLSWNELRRICILLTNEK